MEKLSWTKMFSGRFVFTVICAVLLFQGTIDGKFESKDVLNIIKDVVIFYFIVKQSQSGGKPDA